MEELRAAFLIDSISKLENFREILRRGESLTPEFRRELFRALHTIKGTAQTFGLKTAAHAAHRLENVIEAAQNSRISNEDLRTILPKGIEVLIESLADKDSEFSAQFAEKFQNLLSKTAAANPNSNHFLSVLPEALAAQMSEQEKAALRRTLSAGNNFAILEIGFEPETFADDFKSFREKLNQNGEIIAAFPSAKFAAQNKIGFEFIFVSPRDAAEAIKGSAAEITRQIHQSVPVNLSASVAQMVEYGESLAASFGKKVEFETSVGCESITPQTAKVIFDALLHLVRNAIDHGVEREGKIKIEITDAEAGKISLKVSDDGRGIDLEKLRRKAIEKNLIAPDASLSERETLNLIFAHGFSTGETVTEISGRGVGLDAVKDAVEKAGGEISVESRSGEGTTFEIWLKEK